MAGFDWNTFYTIVETKMKAVCPDCKVGRYTTSNPSTFPYCDIALLDNSGGNYDLQGNEGSQSPTLTISAYATGSSADSTCEQISSVAKEIMLSYGFQCRGGPIPISNETDPNISCWVSKYQRIFGSGDELKQLH